jgi:carbon storage regulator
MLILNRKKRQGENEILIGDDIVIRVMSLGAGQVSIGIEAPPDTLILRGELLPNLDAPEFRPINGKGNA